MTPSDATILRPLQHRAVRALVPLVAVWLSGTSPCAGSLTDICIDASGTPPASGRCASPAISADGHHVAFISNAPNMVPGDTGGSDDIFVKDLSTGTLQRIGAGTRPRLSGDGRYVAFNAGSTIAVRDRVAGTTTTVVAAGSPFLEDMTPDGRYLLFTSKNPNLDPLKPVVIDDYYEYAIYLLDKADSSIEAIALAHVHMSRAIARVASLSPDGRYVTFTNYGSFIIDRADNTTERLDIGPNEEVSVNNPSYPVISADGSVALFRMKDWEDVLGCRAPWSDVENWVYVRDRGQSTTQCWRIASADEWFYYSPDGDGDGPGNVAISNDGRYFATPVFVADRQLGTSVELERLGASRFGGMDASLSADGDVLVFREGRRSLTAPPRLLVLRGVQAIAACGNGILDGEEECDDGNFDDYDSCSACRVNVCGDGIVHLGNEDCDDGNITAHDGCGPTCKSEYLAGGGAPRTDCLHEWRLVPIPPLVDDRGRPVKELSCKDDDPSCDFGSATGDGMCTFRVSSCVNVDDWRGAKDPARMCAPADLEWFELKSPNPQKPRDAIDAANRDAIEAGFAASFDTGVAGRCSSPAENKGWSCVDDADCDIEIGDGKCAGRYMETFLAAADGTLCSGYMDIRVPVKKQSGAASPGKRKFKLTVRSAPTLVENEDDGDSDAEPVERYVITKDSDKLTLVCVP